MADADVSKVNAISMAISFASAGVWVIYALSGAPGWLLIVGILFSMFTGWWWAFGRAALFPNAVAGGGRQPNRERSRR